VPNYIKPTTTLNCGGNLLTLDVPRIMGILNTTPDSFFDGGQYNRVDNALFQVEKMLNDGADIIDVGGYSSRPGAIDISVEEEIERTAPIINALCRRFPDSIISIDTFRAAVAKECLQAGATIVNDIAAGDDDPDMFALIAQKNVPYIIMHKQGNPQTMQQNPVYNDVLSEVLDYLAKKVALLHSLHIHDVVVDPGFGFGKTVAHNFILLKNLAAFEVLGVPILAGVSRKSLINKVLGTKAADALNGTTVLNTIALQNGANLLRVHDVKEATQAVKLIEFYKQV
jgi:dihydropteroate synthase